MPTTVPAMHSQPEGDTDVTPTETPTQAFQLWNRRCRPVIAVFRIDVCAPREQQLYVTYNGVLTTCPQAQLRTCWPLARARRGKPQNACAAS